MLGCLSKSTLHVFGTKVLFSEREREREREIMNSKIKEIIQ